MSKVEEFIKMAYNYLGDKYSQPKRMQKGYSDCSSLVYKALSDAGYITNPGLTVTTHRMGVEGDKRFREIPMSQLRRGDILWGGNYINGRWSGHVAIYLGNGKTIEAIKRGVVEYVKRPYFTKAFRVVALEEKANIKTNKASYVLLYVRGKEAKISPFVIDGTSYIRVGKQDVSVRAFFEKLGMVVKWDNTKRAIIVE